MCCSKTTMSFLHQSLDQSAWGFDPRSHPGCILWLDAKDPTTLFRDFAGTIPITAVDQSVNFWRDKSSNSNNARNIFSNVPDAPKWDTSYSGLSFISNGGYLDCCAAQFPTSNTSILIAAVVRSRSPRSGFFNGPNGYIFGWGSNKNFPVALSTRNTQTFGNPPFDSGYAQVGTDFGINEFPVATDLCTTTNIVNIYDVSTVLTFQITQGKAWAWRDGSDYIGQNGTNVNYNVTPSNATLGFGWGGIINEVIVYNMSSNDASTVLLRRAVEGYLRWKWNTTTFGSPHPYVSRPPLATWFDPRDINNCVAWVDALDACYGFRLTSGSTSNVSSVLDKSGRGATMTISGSLLWESNVFNNRGGFNMSNARIRGTFASGNICTAFSNTCFMVCKYDRLPGAGEASLSLGTSITGGGVFFRALDYAVNFRAVSFFSTVNAAQIAAQTLSAFIWTESYNGSNNSPLSVSSNAGVSNASSTVVTAPTSNATNFFIGADSFTDNQDICGLPGKLGEVIIYNRVLTTQEIQRVQGYLSWKWGVSQILGTHPFASNRLPPNTPI